MSSDRDVSGLIGMARCANDPSVAGTFPRHAVNQTDSEGYAPLIFAAQSGHHLMVESLLGLGAAVDQRPAGSHSALGHACFFMAQYLGDPHRHPTARMLGRASPDSPEAKFFRALPRPDYVETVRLLLDAGADANLMAPLVELDDDTLHPPLDLLFFGDSTPETDDLAAQIAELLVAKRARVKIARGGAMFPCLRLRSNQDLSTAFLALTCRALRIVPCLQACGHSRGCRVCGGRRSAQAGAAAPFTQP